MPFFMFRWWFIIVVSDRQQVFLGIDFHKEREVYLKGSRSSKDKVFLWEERGFLRFFQVKLDNQGLGLLYSLTLEQWFLSDPQKD
jgi:hypothetical protein